MGSGRFRERFSQKLFPSTPPDSVYICFTLPFSHTHTHTHHNNTNTQLRPLIYRQHGLVLGRCDTSATLSSSSSAIPIRCATSSKVYALIHSWYTPTTRLIRPPIHPAIMSHAQQTRLEIVANTATSQRSPQRLSGQTLQRIGDTCIHEPFHICGTSSTEHDTLLHLQAQPSQLHALQSRQHPRTRRTVHRPSPRSRSLHYSPRRWPRSLGIPFPSANVQRHAPQRLH